MLTTAVTAFEPDSIQHTRPRSASATSPMEQSYLRHTRSKSVEHLLDRVVLARSSFDLAEKAARCEAILSGLLVRRTVDYLQRHDRRSHHMHDSPQSPELQRLAVWEYSAARAGGA